MKQIDSYQVSYSLYGKWQITNEYPSKRDAMAAMWPIIQQFNGTTLPMSLVRRTRYVAEPGDEQQ